MCIKKVTRQVKNCLLCTVMVVFFLCSPPSYLYTYTHSEFIVYVCVCVSAVYIYVWLNEREKEETVMWIIVSLISMQRSIFHTWKGRKSKREKLIIHFISYKCIWYVVLLVTVGPLIVAHSSRKRENWSQHFRVSPWRKRTINTSDYHKGFFFIFIINSLYGGAQ